MKFGPGRAREMRDRLTEMLADQARIARDLARLNERQSEMIGELLIERKGPTPAGPARVIAMRAAG